MITGLLSSGDEVIALDGVYGGTFRMFHKIFNRFGIKFSTHNPKTAEELHALLAKKPKWLIFETPTNPLLDIYDIAEMAAAAKKHGVLTVVDNTFATPYNQNPLALGADLVWHSTTKYIGGHSDVIGGAVMTNDAEQKKQLDFARMAVGLNPSPFDVWLTTRGVKTLAVRMKQHEENAMAIAKWLSKHPKVKKVFYPGLPGHAKHAIAKKQMRGFGGMISVEFNTSLENAKKLISQLSLFSLAESLGGVESLISHPASMTHASIPVDERHRMGIADGLVRLSIGIEDSSDLIEDLDNALKYI
jgi:cystathionine beta-lyase/cystathionine gamma-synthase